MGDKIIYEDEFKRLNNLFKISVIRKENILDISFSIYLKDRSYYMLLLCDSMGYLGDYTDSKTWMLYENMSRLF